LTTRAFRQDGPSAPTTAAQFERVPVAFARLLPRYGVEVPPGASLVFAEALSVVGLSTGSGAYWAGRSTLVKRPEDVLAYDRAFSAFFSGERPPHPIWADPRPTALALMAGAEDAGAEDGEGASATVADSAAAPFDAVLRYSPAEILRAKDFAACSPDERAELEQLVGSARFGAPLRRSRRLRRVRRKGRYPDLPRTVRRAFQTGGEPVHTMRKAPGERPRRIVVLSDVSGSMEAYARLLMRFLHVMVSTRGRVEAFTIGTRLTRITRELSVHDPDVALARAARRVEDWSSGTRLGDTLMEFNQRWGAQGLARGAVVFVFSDGWDRGDPEVLRNEMARLSRVAHEVVWVNPLKASPGYAPLARGMAAALPYVDHFVEGHSLASLEALAGLVAQ
jgi:uncharacterized protein